MDAIWVPITIRRRSYRSATIPPIGATRNTGIWLANPTDPKQQGRTRKPVNQPRLRNALHPGADQGNQLAAEE